ncbi:MAG: MBL fold metallo-hydrolase, partial [Pseudomonadota bacterium]
MGGQAAKALLEVRPDGLYCPPGGFYIDPVRPVDRAIITHAHADHCRAGSHSILATYETGRIAQTRYGENAFARVEVAEPGAVQRIGDVDVWLSPAGHVLGSAQVVIEHGGARAVVSGDYRRGHNPTCAP